MQYQNLQDMTQREQLERIDNLLSELKKTEEYRKLKVQQSLFSKKNAIVYLNDLINSSKKQESKTTDTDNSFLVLNTNLHPFNSIGRVQFKVKNCRGFGTGFLIKKNIVLTAAHNLVSYDPVTQKILYHTDVTFTLKINKESLKLKIKRIKIPDKYIQGFQKKKKQIGQKFKKANDFALMQIDISDKRVHQFLQLHTYLTIRKNWKKEEQSLIMAGFLQVNGIEKLLGGTLIKNQELGKSNLLFGSIIAYTKQHVKSVQKYLYHYSTTQFGQSGAPVMRVLDSEQFKFEVIGIHSGYDTNEQMNCSILFQDYNIQVINKLLSQLNCGELQSYQKTESKVVGRYLVKKLIQRGQKNLDQNWQERQNNFLLEVSKQLTQKTKKMKSLNKNPTNKSHDPNQLKNIMCQPNVQYYKSIESIYKSAAFDSYIEEQLTKTEQMIDKSHRSQFVDLNKQTVNKSKFWQAQLPLKDEIMSPRKKRPKGKQQKDDFINGIYKCWSNQQKQKMKKSKKTQINISNKSSISNYSRIKQRQ